MLILAGVTIAAISGDNGILQNAADAKEMTEEAKKEEEKALAALEAATNVNGSEYKEGDKTIKIPAGYAVSPDEDENNLEDGLVILDSSENEYVWIEVPNDGTGPDYTSVENKTEGTPEYYKAIDDAMDDYVGVYANGSASQTRSDWKDEWHDGCGLEPEEYTGLHHTMLESVYKNGGFWIGRYEAGIAENRTSHTSIGGVTPVSKENQYPLTYVTCSEAQTLASNVNSGNCTSSLMFGVQWDLVMKYLEIKGTSVSDLNSNSTSWGNYYNATITLNRGKYAKNGALNTWYDYTEDLDNYVLGNVKQSATSYSNSILLTTGASDATKKQNIYDLAGNVWEWTLEHATSVSSRPCAFMSGGYDNAGSNTPASYRHYDATTYYYYSIGFRVTLF